ncbi:MAG: multiubiquitin domain-containing protein [Methylophilaceae bacterium]
MVDVNELDEIEVIDLEEYACSDKPIPKRVKYYLIKVDKEKIRVQSPITAAEILVAADIDPKEYHLQQKLRGGKRIKLEPDEEVDLRKPGVERFESVPKEACNG